jgi:signal peptidase I
VIELTDGADGLGPPTDGPSAGQGAAPVEPNKPKGSVPRWLIEAGIIVVVALLVAVLLRAFVVQTFYIPSPSMAPTLQVGDRILVNKLSYHLHGVGLDDIVVFSKPPKEDCGGTPVKDLVKRVVGLPGQTIALTPTGRVVLDGKVQADAFVPAGNQTTPGPSNAPYSLHQPYKIPANDYFLMGDNRDESCDSRYWGPIPRSLIVGKVEVRVWPLTRIGFF